MPGFCYIGELMLIWVMGAGFESTCTVAEVKCLQSYSKTAKISIYKGESYLITSRTSCSGHNNEFVNR